MNIYQTFIKRKLLLLSLLFLVIAIPIAYLTFKYQGRTEAAWYDDRYAYRQPVKITNSSGSNLTNFQVSIGVGTSALIGSGKMQSDCDDIRITDVNGKVLPYWIEENNPGCNSAAADTKVWVKAPLIPASGATLYLYYGNASASSAQNGNNVFEFFDDFNNSSLNTTKWNLNVTNNITYSLTSGQLRVTDGTKSSSTYWIYNNTDNGSQHQMKYGITDNVVVEWRSTINDIAVAEMGQVGFGLVDSSNLVRAYINHMDPNGGTLNADRGWIYETTSGLNDATAASETVNYKMSRSGNNLGFFVNNTSLATGTLTSTPSKLALIVGAYGSYPFLTNVDIDYVFTRKYAGTEPTVTFASEEQSQAPIAYWKFDEGTGTRANSSSEQENHPGTLTSGPTWASEDQCISGKCLKFDGVNDYVNVGPGSDYHPLPLLSVCTWIKSPGLATGMTTNGIFGLGYYLGLDLNSSGRFTTYMWNGSNNVSNTLSDNLYDNQWHYLCLTYDGTNRSMYVDGVNKLTNATTWSGLINFATGTTIGHNNNNPPYYKFNGFIDEFKIYSYARTAAQIKTDYASRGSVKGVALQGGNGQGDALKNLSNGLVGYWKMDENTGSTITDSSGVGTTGSFGIGSSAPTWTTGKYGSGLSFDGTNDYVDTNLAYSATHKTFSFWAKSAVANKITAIPFGIQSPTGNDRFYIGYDNSGNLGLGLGSSGWNNESNGYQLDTNWHNYVIIWDGTTMKLYVDGILKAQKSGSTTASGNYYIGANHYLSSINSPFQGNIDELRVYNRALSPAEVQNLYNFAPGPVGYWDFNIGTGNNAPDISGNNNNGGWAGTLGNQWKAGKFGKAGNFNGTNNSVSIADKDLFSFGDATSDKPFTVSLWAKPNTLDLSVGNWLVNKRDNSTGDEWHLTFSQGKVSWTMFGTDNTHYINVKNNSVSATGQWLYITATYDGSGSTSGMKIYVNGTPAATTAATGGTYTAMHNGTAPVVIGKPGFTSGYYFDGLLDDVKIYNYVRTPKQIVEDMNAGHPAGGSPVGSQVGYWKFDEGYGTVLHNSGSQGVALQGGMGVGSSAPTWTNDGKFAKALSFDGGDYLTIPDSTANSITGDLSLEAWIKVNNLNTGTVQSIIDKYDAVGNQRSYTLQLDHASCTDNYLGLTISSTTSSYTGFIQCSDIALQANRWYHVLATFTAGSNAKIYIDGVDHTGSLVGTMQSSIADSSRNLVIGAGYTNSTTPDDYYFNGLIDEIKIYNYALTASEVALDYNHGASMVLGASSSGVGNTAAATAASQEYCVPGGADLCSPPVAEWNFDERSGGTAYDRSGNGNTASLGVGNTSPTWSAGKISGSLSFNGTSNFIDAGTGFTDNIESAGTISVWTYRKSNTGGIFARSTGSGWVDERLVIYLRSDTNVWGWVFANGTAYQNNPLSFNDFPANQWVYITFTWNGSRVITYVNGKQIDNVAQSATPEITGVKTRFGFTEGLAGKYYNGKIDQVRVYNYARTPSQIAWDYNRGGPVGHWKMDECQGSTAYDSSGNGNNGTITVGASGSQNSLGTCALGVGQSAAWGNGASGKRNYSLSFDGSDDYIDAGTAPVFNLTNALSVSAWVKTSSADNQHVVGRALTGSGDHTFLLSVSPDHYNDFIVANGYSFGTADAIEGTKTVNDGNWHHLVGTFDGSTLTIYTDGKYDNSKSKSTKPTSNTSLKLTIGKLSGYSNFFNGQIDDVKIFNYALTGTQVKSLYNGGAVSFGQ